jgi:hypothetical protein
MLALLRRRPLVALLLLPALLAASPGDPLATLNQEFRTIYAGNRTRLLAGTRPLIVYDSEKLTLLRESGRAEADVQPERYRTLRTVSHVPLAVYLLLAGTDGELDDKCLAEVRRYRALIPPARDGLAKTDLAPAVRERQQDLLEESLAFLDGVLARKRAKRDELLAFVRKVKPRVMENVAEAARAQIDALHAQVQAWKKQMTADEWRNLRVVVQGTHMPRADNVGMQYFAWALGGAVDERRLIYTEGIFDEERSLNVLGTSLQDSGIAEAFFDDPLRMHRDLLGDAARAYLKQLAGSPQEAVPAAGPGRKRELLYPADPAQVPESLRPYVARLLSKDQPAPRPEDAMPEGVYLRVVSRRFVLDGRDLKEGAWLGPAPFVFVTVPDTLYGKSLLESLSDIGYSADEVLRRQLGDEKVAVVFAPGDAGRLHAGRDGDLPADWPCHVYPATWDNLFGLVGRMASDRERYVAVRKEGNAFEPRRLLLRSEEELGLLLNYPAAGKARLKSASYYALRDGGGADWVYRALLERTTGASEHYAGDGYAKPTFGKSKGQRGFPEFLAPNSELKAVPRVVVIGLGALPALE